MLCCAQSDASGDLLAIPLINPFLAARSVAGSPTCAQPGRVFGASFSSASDAAGPGAAGAGGAHAFLGSCGSTLGRMRMGLQAVIEHEHDSATPRAGTMQCGDGGGGGDDEGAGMMPSSALLDGSDNGMLSEQPGDNDSVSMGSPTSSHASHAAGEVSALLAQVAPASSSRAAPDGAACDHYEQDLPLTPRHGQDACGTDPGTPMSARSLTASPMSMSIKMAPISSAASPASAWRARVGSAMFVMCPSNSIRRRFSEAGAAGGGGSRAGSCVFPTALAVGGAGVLGEGHAPTPELLQALEIEALQGEGEAAGQVRPARCTALR